MRLTRLLKPLASLLIATATIAGQANGAVCKVVACRNDGFPFKIVDADSGTNITGECSRQFRDAMDTFHNLEETGQCNRAIPATECVIARCANDTSPLRVVAKDTEQNAFDGGGVCFTSMEYAVEALVGLQYTGQCARSAAGSPCGVDRRCNNANYQYRVFYSESDDNVTGLCYQTLEDAMQAFRSFVSVGQCTRNP